MPIYDYKCENCGCFDKMQKISEEPLSECPTCGGPVKRIISKNIGIVFKGSGFYSTDNKIKDRARSLNKARQTDNKAILDGDVKSFVKESENTTKKHLEA
ncbi:MAG: zinc ribbon domain-containing protein [Syntrophomonadaceae bacterium]|nr:zinc ribbon domain-containing protein [Syntrophomonadaceae bacterium]MDD3889555.1 zinc ribbon domain-containing protein [Syntrophomonadaceae bacterium]MDD4549099.1 zinc ribbon domain-containing protein [Syntrophomonadaceae bacterium]